MIQGAVRWNTYRRSTSGWIEGTYWIAEAPVPIEATRRPRRSWSWFQRAEWKLVPSNVSSPGSSGVRGSASGPMPDTRTRAVNGPWSVSSRQRRSSSSHSALSTV